MESKHYNALVSPDAYEYLDKAPEDELLHDKMLEEQEAMEDSDLFDDDETEASQEDTDDSDMYQYNSLFDEFDNEEESDDKIVSEEPVEKDDLVFKDEDDDSITVNSSLEDSVVFNEKINDLIKTLPKYDPVAVLMNSMTKKLQDEVLDTIEKAHERLMSDGKDKMFVIPHTHTSVAILSQTYDPMVSIQRLENIGAVMVANDQTLWNALMLYYAQDGTLAEVSTVSVSQSSFTDWQWKTVLQRGMKLKALN